VKPTPVIIGNISVEVDADTGRVIEPEIFAGEPLRTVWVYYRMTQGQTEPCEDHAPCQLLAVGEEDRRVLNWRHEGIGTRIHLRRTLEDQPRYWTELTSLH